MTNIPRRQFLGSAATALAATGGGLTPGGGFSFAPRSAAAQTVDLPIAGNIEKIEHLGVYLGDCTLPGDTKVDGVVPRHATCIQVARDRWMVLYSTHGYRGVDDERSIVYQIRRDAPDGPVVREGYLAKGINDWQPEGLTPPEGFSYFKQHGHMTAFGVPKGAVVGGAVPPHANLFVAKWRTLARPLEKAKNYLHKTPKEGELVDATKYVEYVQFRLNPTDDDIEIVQPVQRLRQLGFEVGPQFTSLDVKWMNQSFCPAVPFDALYTEWLDCNHFDGGRLAVLRYRFAPETGMYAWVDSSPLIADPKVPMMEASLAIHDSGWVIAARSEPGIAWLRAVDPLAVWHSPHLGTEPYVAAPITLFRCADGVLRLFTGDPKVSPHKNGRDPLYCWDVVPGAEVTVTNRRVIFDSVAAGLPIRPEAKPKLDFCELFPHHGKTQLIVHGVNTRAYEHPYENRTDIPAMTPTERQVAGLYYARITYSHEPHALWRFPQ